MRTAFSGSITAALKPITEAPTWRIKRDRRLDATTAALARDSDADVLVIRRRIVMEGTPDFATGKAAEFDCDWSDDDPDYDVVSYRLIAAGTVTLAT